MSRRATFLLLGLLLPACSMPERLDGSGPDFSYRPVGSGGTGMSSAPTGDPRSAVHTELIQTMLVQHQYYAALAHIQQMVRDGGSTSELRYLEAETRRKLGQNREAEALYRGLARKDDYAGQAYHGLGLLAASEGDLAAAVQYLRNAAGLRPTDAETRNDLGYALMLAGRHADALPEIATAVELAPDDDRGRNNLLLLLILTKDEAGVRRVVAESGVKPDALARLRAQAQSLGRRPVKEKR